MPLTARSLTVRRSAGSRNSPLSAHGVVQAKRLGVHLAGRRPETGPVSHIFSSNLDRALQTAEAIREALSIVESASSTGIALAREIVQLEELREKDFGSLEGTRGRPVMVPEQQSESAAASDRHVEPESFTALAGRATRFVDAVLLPLLEELVKQDATQSVVVVAHGIIQTHVWTQFLTAMTRVSGSAVPRPDVKPIEIRPANSFLANTGYHELIIKRQAAFGPSAAVSEREGFRLYRSPLLGCFFSVTATNCVTHLAGLKRTKGGIGNVALDSKQRTMDSFFKKTPTEHGNASSST